MVLSWHVETIHRNDGTNWDINEEVTMGMRIVWLWVGKMATKKQTDKG